MFLSILFHCEMIESKSKLELQSARWSCWQCLVLVAATTIIVIELGELSESERTAQNTSDLFTFIKLVQVNKNLEH